MSRLAVLCMGALLLLGIPSSVQTIGVSRGTRAGEKVKLELTYPNGSSPKVFTTGWTFGAKATVDPGTNAPKDISSQVKWSGTAVFTPSTGAIGKPVFRRAGRNTIKLTVVVDRQEYSREFAVEAVAPRHATIGCRVRCDSCAHGCPVCPHKVVGTISTGNGKVLINGRPVACAGDKGAHAACCGPNIFTVSEGDPDVLVDGKPVARIGDKTTHCGGSGWVIEAYTPSGLVTTR